MSAISEGAAIRRRHRRRADLVIAALVAVLIVGGIAGALAIRQAHAGAGSHVDHPADGGAGAAHVDHPAAPAWSPVAGGRIAVRGVNTSTVSQMPGMPLPDAAPPGYRRFAVTLAVEADEAGLGVVLGDGALIAGAGIGEPVPPLHVVPAELVVPAGMRAEAVLVFQVPEQVDALELALPGLISPLPISLGAPDVTSHGHEDDASATSVGVPR